MALPADFLRDLPMFRRLLPVASITIGLGLAFGACYFAGRREPPLPVPCTCRDLHERPGDYAGRRVAVELRGSAREAAGAVWYPQVPGPPAVVVTFEGATPDPLPAVAVGNCHGPVAGGPVRVTEARPGR